MTTTSELSVRLPKIAHIVQDLEVSHSLALASPTDFASRCIARHVLIRAKDLIFHFRGVKKLLRAAGFNIAAFHTEKETYAQYFDEYFQVARDKLSGHVQDLDFVERLELWNAIEVAKLSFFVDAAREIYESTIDHAADGYSLLSPRVDKAVNLRLMLAGPLPSGGEDGPVLAASDPLAFARPNTTAAFNFSTVHQRAGQLSLLRLWIHDQFALLDRLDGTIWQWESQVLITRLLTDIVSFCDCLVTNSNATGPSALIGLCDLVRNDYPNLQLDTYLARVRFEEILGQFREIRNRVGGHYELSPTYDQAALARLMSCIAVPELRNFADSVLSAFASVCRDAFYLTMYQGGPVALTGISMDSRREYRDPFDPSRQSVTRRPTPVREVSWSTDLETWITGQSEALLVESRGRLWNGFVAGLPFSRTGGYLNDCHKEVLRRLDASSSQHDSTRIVELLVSCKGGSPSQGSQLLLEHRKNHAASVAGALDDDLIFSAWGELADWRDREVIDVLTACSEAPMHPLRVLAFRSLFKAALRSSYMANANKRPGTRIISLAMQLAPRDTFGRLASACIAFAETHLGSYPFAIGTRSSFVEQRDLLLASMVPYGCGAFIDSAHNLLDGVDVVGALVILAERLSVPNREKDRTVLLNLAASGLIQHRNDRQGWNSVAVANFHAGNFVTARYWADVLVDRHPEELRYHLLRAEVLRKLNAEAELKAEQRRIEQLFMLDEETRATLWRP